jgi:hypothetical protein
VGQANPELSKLPGRTTLHVEASFSDGSVGRVEDLAIYSPADPAATVVDELGRVQVLRPGRHTIVVRYLSQATAVQISVAYPGKQLDTALMPRNNWIDARSTPRWPSCESLPPGVLTTRRCCGGSRSI